MPATDSPRSLVNGDPDTVIPVTDRGLQYGDGVFETLSVVQGEMLCWDAHCARLLEGCRRLHLNPPAIEILAEEAGQLVAGQERAVLKIMITRGSSGRGYRPEPDAIPSRILTLHNWPEWPQENTTAGVVIRVCQQRLAQSPALAGIKHLNRLEQILARAEWDDPAIAEGLMLDMAGHVIEGTMSNVFVFKGNQLLTPDLSQCGIAGVIRGRVLETARALGIDAMIAELELSDIESADSLFLCNSLIGLWPVRKVGEREYAISPRIADLREKLQHQDCIAAV
ncbi:MAG: aminodeoxychorismate lyase [Pseudomonadales bacterium]